MKEARVEIARCVHTHFCQYEVNLQLFSFTANQSTQTHGVCTHTHTHFVVDAKAILVDIHSRNPHLPCFSMRILEMCKNQVINSLNIIALNIKCQTFYAFLKLFVHFHSEFTLEIRFYVFVACWNVNEIKESFLRPFFFTFTSVCFSAFAFFHTLCTQKKLFYSLSVLPLFCSSQTKRIPSSSKSLVQSGTKMFYVKHDMV